MEKPYVLKITLTLSWLFAAALLHAQLNTPQSQPGVQKNTPLPYPFSNGQSGNLYLHNPVRLQTLYNRQRNRFTIRQGSASPTLSPMVIMSAEAYRAYMLRQQLSQYYRDKSRQADQKARKVVQQYEAQIAKNALLSVPVTSPFLQAILGGSAIQLIPQGYASLDLGGHFQKVDNPQIPRSARSSFSLDFDPRIQLALTGQFGKNFSLKANYDTKASFSFENRLNFNYEGQEDDIVKKVDVGNVAMNFRNPLINGAQDLFGLRTDLQFGKTYVSAVLSQQRSKTRNITVKNGSTVHDFKVRAFDYEENTHYFLSQFFRDHYDRWLLNYPVITSGLTISRIEVWVLNTNSAATENTRNILAFADLGERDRLTNPALVRPGPSRFPAYSSRDPSKNSNDLYRLITHAQTRDHSSADAAMKALGFRADRDFALIENAKLLDQSEYHLNTQLGYISLNRPLRDDQVLAVSFQYVLNGAVYQVGEFAADRDAPDNLVVKLLKSSGINVSDPLWDLMMKNIYDLGGTQLSSEGFDLNILYRDDQTGTSVNYLPNAGQAQKLTLNQLLHMDRLNQNARLGADGLFDYQPGITIEPASGRLIFTTVEPFGHYLRTRLQRLQLPQQVIDRYVFEDLYKTTKLEARETNSAKDKFFFQGHFQGSQATGGISIGVINPPRGSVKVTAGGKALTEGVDYTIDYQSGTLQLLNENLKASSTPVNVSVEDNAVLDQQQKRFFGIDLQHQFDKNFLLGATYLNYAEKPLTQKASYGIEPVNNTVLGLNGLYNSDDLPFLTDLVNKLPFVYTEAPSRISTRMNFAYLKPGSPKGIDFEGESTSYVDSFEDTQANIPMKDWTEWFLASTPGGSGQTEFDGDADALSYGYHRAKMAWYTIDPLFYGLGAGRPANIDSKALSTDAVREVSVREVFPNRDVIPGSSQVIPTFDLTIFPTRRGPYNFDPTEARGIADPQGAWAGIMRPIYTSNFEKANIQYIQFWLMDPFEDDQRHTGGDLYFQLGEVSEDILKDGKKQYENGLPVKADSTAVETTPWGRVPSQQSTTYAFNTEDAERASQDLGLDGLSDAQEQAHYGSAFGADPSADDYKHFLDKSYDAQGAGIITRYEDFNGVQGNSPSGVMAATAYPDVEDINRDQTMNRTERYYQYKISIRPQDLRMVGSDYIKDIRQVNVRLKDGTTRLVKWYQFKVPISVGKPIGGISSWRSVRFMRLVLKGFSRQTTLRFATLDLVRTGWRRYGQALKLNVGGQEDKTAPQPELADFDVEGVNLVSNAHRHPIPYVMPPGVSRERLYNTTAVQDQDEGSMVLRVRDLPHDDARAAYRYATYDLRRYKHLKLFVHAEAQARDAGLGDGDLVAFIRLGNDMTDNYYEYEVPLKLTRLGATAPSDIWPEENNLDVNLADLVRLKLKRDAAGQVSITQRYAGVASKSGARLWVKGRPSLSNVSVIMLGVRNRRHNQLPASAELWFDELRVSGFDKQGGWAASAALDLNLADFAQLSLSGTHTTRGYGGISQTLVERNQDDKTQYAFSTNVNLNMLTPKKWGLNLPLNYSVQGSFTDPKYNPLDQDVKLSALQGQARDSALRIARSYTRRTSVNLLNIRKNKAGGKPRHFYDVENFTFGYAYDQQYQRDIKTRYAIRRELRTSADYAYSFTPWVLQPMKHWHLVQDSSKWGKYLEGLKLFNFNPLPSQFSFRTAITRSYDERMLRNLSLSPQSLSPDATFSYDFKLNYQYNLAFDPTRSLRLNLTATTNRVLENLGAFERNLLVTDPLQSDYNVEQPDRDLIYKHLFDLGRPFDYTQQFSGIWKTPLHYLPFFKWADVDLTYRASYHWNAASTVSRWTSEEGDTVNLGNTIENTAELGANASLDFNQLVERTPFLRKSRARLNAMGQAPGDSSAVGTSKPAKPKFYDYALMLLSGLQNAQISYAQQAGSVIPGFQDEVGFLGRGPNGPNLGFLFGNQTDILRDNRLQRWHISTDRYISPYQRTESQKTNYQLMMAPLPALSITFSGQRDYTHSMVFTNFNVPTKRILNEMGNFFTTCFTLPTAFEDPAQTFATFKENRITIANRLARRPAATTFPVGYGPTSQSVLIPAFLAAYTGRSPERVSLGALQRFPIPNWTLVYTGLTRFKFVRKYFDQFEIRHAYRATYSMGFASNLDYYNDQSASRPVDQNGDYLSPRTYDGLKIEESYAPLIGLNLIMKNNMQLSIDYNRTRLLNLSLINKSLTESINAVLTLGLGYTIKGVKFRMRIAGKTKTAKSDLHLKADVVLNHSETAIRKLAEASDQLISGQDQLGIRMQGDYNFGKRLNLRLYYNQNVSKYAASSAFPLSDIKFGLAARFNFGN